MKNKDDFMVMVEIAKRAETLNLLYFDRMSLMMDLENVHEQMNLDLSGLLESDDSNFTHDLIGIQRHFDRATKRMMNCFVPRYARG